MKTIHCLCSYGLGQGGKYEAPFVHGRETVFSFLPDTVRRDGEDCERRGKEMTP